MVIFGHLAIQCSINTHKETAMENLGNERNLNNESSTKIRY